MLDPNPGDVVSNLKPHDGLTGDITSSVLPIFSANFDTSNLENDGELGIKTDDLTLWKRVSATEVREINSLSEFFENSDGVKWLGGGSYAEGGGDSNNARYSGNINSDILSKRWLDEKEPKPTADSEKISYFWYDARKECLRKSVTVYGYDYPNPDSEYFRYFKKEKHRFDFDLLEPGTQEKQVITKKIRHISFGTRNLMDINEQNLLPALFLEAGSNAHERGFPGMESAKEGEVMPVVLRLWMREPKPSELSDVAYRDSNPIFIAQMREQLDYLLDPSEFKGISMIRIGYTLPSSVYDCGITSSYTMQGIRAPFECIDFRFEVIFSKQKEIDDRYGV